MDRRRFLKKSPVAGAGLIGISSAANSRLYGQPSSVIDSHQAADFVAPHFLRLHLSLAGANVDYANCCLAVARLAKDILQDRSIAESFVADPEGYLTHVGFPNTHFNTQTPEFAMALALADPDVRRAALPGNPITFLNEISRANAANPDSIQPIGGPGIVNVNALVNVTIYLNAAVGFNAAVVLNAAAGIFAVALLLIVVVTIVAPLATSPELAPKLAIADALGGDKFAQDVMRIEARNEIEKLIGAIQDGSWKLPDGLAADEAINGLKMVIQKHFA